MKIKIIHTIIVPALICSAVNAFAEAAVKDSGTGGGGRDVSSILFMDWYAEEARWEAAGEAFIVHEELDVDPQELYFNAVSTRRENIQTTSTVKHTGTGGGGRDVTVY